MRRRSCGTCVRSRAAYCQEITHRRTVAPVSPAFLRQFDKCDSSAEAESTCTLGRTWLAGSHPGQLPGHTSWTVSVKRNGALDTFGENIMQIFSTRAA